MSPAETSHQPTHRQILQHIKDARGSYCSGTALAAELGLSRTGIWKHIQNLRTLGYDIESHPKEGYRLLSVPDLLVPEEVEPQLTTRWMGRSYHYFLQIASTNDEALRLAARGAPDGTVVVAEEQTHGRGRLQRPWLSPSRCGIYASLLLRTALPVREAALANLVAALAYVKILRRLYALPAGIKWPNDILIRGKKAAGILTEMQSDQDFTRFLVVGIGMNVNHDATHMDASFRYPGTSVALELGHSVPRQEILMAFLEQFEAQYDLFLENGFESLMGVMEEYSIILGKMVRVQTTDGELAGKVTGFNPQGALKLRLEDGREETVWVGDVTHVRGDFT